MNRFWEDVISPVIIKVDAKHIVEIGCKDGKNTMKILNYCKQNNAKASLIDPFPQFDKDIELYKDHYTLYEDLSLNVLYKLKDYDVVLIDGDHNYYTVYHELKTIEKHFSNEEMPIIFIHDISWPYARRDLYYNPDTIPDRFRQPYEKKGILMDQGSLAEIGGINAHLFNAIYENDLNNGVLTAVEDFISQTNVRLDFIKFECFNGLGVLVSQNKKNIVEFIHDLQASDSLLKKIEKNRNELEIKLSDLRISLEQKEIMIKELTQVNEELKKEVDRIKNDKKEIEKQLLDYKNKIQEKEITINDLSIENINIKEKIEKYIKQQEGIQFQKQEKIDKLQDNMKKLEQELKHKEQLLVKAETAANIHLNSVRYKLGDAIILALKPSKHTLFLPFRIVKLFKEGLQKVKNRKENKHFKNKQEIKKIDSIFMNNENKKKIVDFNNISSKEIVELNKKIINSVIPNSKPLVSIIMLNRNGSHHLKRFFKAFKENTIYPNYEIIVVDNASTDDSILVLEEEAKELPITIIKNNKNTTFSEGNNQAVKYAKGQYLLLINNDIEPTYGWLNELIKCEQKTENPGAIGAKLIYPTYPESSLNKKNSLKVQHIGIAFREEASFIRPYNMGHGYEPFDQRTNQDTIRAGVTAATMLIKKDVFLEVGGLDERYEYGYEDVDLSLKLHQKGYNNIYCSTSLLFHHEFGTQCKDNKKVVSKRRRRNMDIFYQKWYEWLSKKILYDKLNNQKLFTERSLKVSFVVESVDTIQSNYGIAIELAEIIKSYGWEISYLNSKHGNQWYKVDVNVDILICFSNIYDLSCIKGAKDNLIKIAMVLNDVENWIKNSQLQNYDLAFTIDPVIYKKLKNIFRKKVNLLPNDINKNMVNKLKEILEEYVS